jgi:hypothetical protein
LGKVWLICETNKLAHEINITSYKIKSIKINGKKGLEKKKSQPDLIIQIHNPKG